ncbi:MAG: polysaccharide biosynthesis tyrosine autokinase [Planctomycetaceae bacterium]
MDPYTLEPVESNEQQGFHALLRFLRVVRRHKSVLVGLIGAAILLGVVYFKRTPQEFESSAKLMVRQLQADSNEGRNDKGNGLLMSYQQLLLSDKVLTSTVEKLTTRPPELKDSERTQWPGILRTKLLNVTFEEDGNVIEIRCRSRNAEACVDVIHALIAASSTFMESFQKNEALDTVKKLDERREELEKSLFLRERDLLQARKDCGDLAVNESSEESHPLVQRVNHLNDTLTTVRSRRLELESMLASARGLVATNSDLTLALQKLDSIVGPKVMEQLPGTPNGSPESIRKLNDELKKLETEWTALRRHYGSGHSEIIRLEAAIRMQQQHIAAAENEARQQVNVGIRDPQVGQWLIATIEAAVRSTQQYEYSLQQEYNQVEQQALSLSDKLAAIQLAEREVETLRQSHSSLLNRLTSINIQPDGGIFRAAVLTEPLVPKFPVFPVLTHVLAAFCVIAIAIGLGVIYVMDLLDDRFRSPEEVREELGLPVLGVVRKLPEHEINAAKIYVHGFPQTPHAECFRTLKTSLTLSPIDTKCLAITSTEASEGKTTTTVNLAASYAQTGVRTLLIDADMRRPGLSRLLEVRGHGGLSEVLRAESNIPEMCRERIVKTDVPLLEVLPCGPRILNAGMLLSMPSLSDILDWAVSEYDQVIVDCPPTLPVSDAAIVGRFVDSMLFLMNPDKTHRRSVTRAIDQLRAMDLKIVGIVANTSLSKENNGYGYEYGYGYGNDYSYGHDDHDDDDVVDAVKPFGSIVNGPTRDDLSADNNHGKAA